MEKSKFDLNTSDPASTFEYIELRYSKEYFTYNNLLIEFPPDMLVRLSPEDPDKENKMICYQTYGGSQPPKESSCQASVVKNKRRRN